VFARGDEVDRRFGEVNERLEETENEIRKTQVWVEKLDDDIRAVAEGVVSVRQELEEHKAENRQEHEATRSLLRFSHGQLHRRQDELDERVAALEAGAH